MNQSSSEAPSCHVESVVAKGFDAHAGAIQSRHVTITSLLSETFMKNQVKERKGLGLKGFSRVFLF